MRLNLGPRNLAPPEASPWYEQYAILPIRVENKVIWFEKYYMRLVPVRDYNSYLSKTSECQWGYKMDQELRLPENIDKEY